jgi:phosphate transport system permease protein
MAGISTDAKVVSPTGSRLETRRSSVAFIQRGMKSVTFVSALLSIITTVGIVAILFTNALPFFQKVPIQDFFLGREWAPQAGKFGVLPLVTGTLMITVGAALVAVPLGLLVGIYLAEYAPSKVRQILKPALELLAGVPTVVYGYFALTFITPQLRHLFPEIAPLNALSGALVVGIMILPLVSSLCEDAITAVPRSLREGAIAMGSTKFESITRVVIPAALSGIVASFILAVSRAVGEVMAVSIAAGSSPRLTFNPLDPVLTMTSTIVLISKGDVDRFSVNYYTIFAVGLSLFAITLILNIIANLIVRKYRQVYA